MKNSKLTLYMNKRESFDLCRAPAFVANGTTTTVNAARWYEFSLGVVDWRTLYVMFRLDDRSDLFDTNDATTSRAYIGAAERQTLLAEEDGSRGDGGKLRIAVTAFVRAVVIATARLLPMNSKTVRGGLPSVRYNVAGAFNVAPADFQDFARHITSKLSAVNMGRDCAMSEIKFYMCEHGLRLRNEDARRLVNEMTDVEHPHIDVVQVHRADNLTFPNGDPIVARLDDGSLRSALVGVDAIRLSSNKVDKFRVPEQFWLLRVSRTALVRRSRGDVRSGVLVSRQDCPSPEFGFHRRVRVVSRLRARGGQI